MTHSLPNRRSSYLWHWLGNSRLSSKYGRARVPLRLMMISNEQFTFIHVHKTGGRSLNSVITQCIPGSEVVGYHYPYAMLPAGRQHLPVVGVVRNPWAWYVSWYAFNRKLGMRNPL